MAKMANFLQLGGICSGDCCNKVEDISKQHKTKVPIRLAHNIEVHKNKVQDHTLYASIHFAFLYELPKQLLLVV